MGCEAGGEVLGEAGGAEGAAGWDLPARLGAGPVLVNVFRPLGFGQTGQISRRGVGAISRI